MGALTSNRKRGHDYLYPNYANPNPDNYFINNNNNNSHTSKISKIVLSSSMHHNKSSSSSPSSNNNNNNNNTGVSRWISQYPKTKPTMPRQVHAPVRILKFGLSKPRPIVSTHRVGMWSSLTSKYKDIKEKAFGSLRFVKEKIIHRDDERTKQNVREEIILSDDDDDDDDEVQIVEKSKVGDIDVVVDLEDETNCQPSSSLSILIDADLCVNDAGKLFDSMSLGQDVTESNIEAYKNLLEYSGRNDSRLEALDCQIQFIERKRLALQDLRIVTKPAQPEIPHEPFVPLSKEDVAFVNRAFSNRNNFNVLVTHQNSGIDITGKMLQCLRPGQWLNDEVINVYLELLKERERREPKKFLKCHFFNTFFYNKVRGGGFKAVKRWTTIRKLGYYLADCDKIFVPIHKQVHWCSAIINAKDKKFQYLDSLKGRDPEVLKALASYYVEEVKHKSGKDIDVSSWGMEFVEDLPEQENGFDCGMFMVKYADFYSRGVGLCFNQAHMPYFRLRTANEILKLRTD
ncbi:hypothetical protein ACFE04_005477 [Oxalis oulophora]